MEFELITFKYDKLNLLWKQYTTYEVHKLLVKLEKVVTSSKTQYMLGTIFMTSTGKAVRMSETE